MYRSGVTNRGLVISLRCMEESEDLGPWIQTSQSLCTAVLYRGCIQAVYRLYTLLYTCCIEDLDSSGDLRCQSRPLELLMLEISMIHEYGVLGSGCCSACGGHLQILRYSSSPRISTLRTID